uniref:protein PALS2-like n=1 Tax=Myxine glutinosa TaxID=7769 RepID=UPI00358EA46C
MELNIACLLSPQWNMEKVLQKLPELPNAAGAKDTDLIFLRGLMESPIIQSLAKVQTRLEEPKLEAVRERNVELVHEIVEDFAAMSQQDGRAAELLNILQEPHFQVVLDSESVSWRKREVSNSLKQPLQHFGAVGSSLDFQPPPQSDGYYRAHPAPEQVHSPRRQTGSRCQTRASSDPHKAHVALRTFTVALRTFTVALRTFTVALRTFTVALRTFTVALRTLTVALRTLTVALRTFTVALRTFTVALRTFTVALRTFTVALRTFTVALRTFTVALRTFTVALRTFTVALRTFTVALRTFTVALRTFTVALRTFTVALRTFTVALRTFTVALLLLVCGFKICTALPPVATSYPPWCPAVWHIFHPATEAKMRDGGSMGRGRGKCNRWQRPGPGRVQAEARSRARAGICRCGAEGQVECRHCQACKVQGGGRVGLVPSQTLEEKRKAYVRSDFDYSVVSGRFCGGLRGKKKKRMMYVSTKNAEFDQHEILLYEEVANMPPFQRRTLVLIGAQGVGRRSLKNRLIVADPARYRSTVPCTSRQPRDDEYDRKSYRFVHRSDMEADIKMGAYLESGEYDGNLYGTRIDSVRNVMSSGRTCVLDTNPQALKLLRTAEYMPYVVFIAAPPLAVLQAMHRMGLDAGTTNKQLTDNDLKKTSEESNRIQQTYGHYFDVTIVNEGLDETFKKLLQVLNQLTVDYQWVPVSWVY